MASFWLQDTGWIQLDAIVGNDPILSSQATADWVLEFAPGAEISNVSLQVHVMAPTVS